MLEISLLSGLAKLFQQARLPLTRHVSARSRASGCPASAPPGLPASPSPRVAAARIARRSGGSATRHHSADLRRVILVRHGPVPPREVGLVVRDKRCQMGYSKRIYNDKKWNKTVAPLRPTFESLG